MNILRLSPLLVVGTMASRDFMCTSTLTENLGIRCEDLSEPDAKGCCQPDTCEGMACCPKNCNSLSMSTLGSEKTCTCTNTAGGACADTIVPNSLLEDLSEPQRWTAAHNTVRCLHGQPPLKWTQTTYDYAKTWADTCTYAHSTSDVNGGNGENLARQKPAYQFPYEQATYAWYHEVTEADGGRGYRAGTASNNAIYGQSGGPDQVGHYTALIWKDTKELGCARCLDDGNGFEIQVCQYSNSTPNIIGGTNGVQYFVDNVPQSNTLVKTEAFCCNKAYSDVSGLAPGDISGDPNSSGQATATASFLLSAVVLGALHLSS